MFVNTEITDILPRTPQHRRQPTSAAKGRVMIAAMAAGAAAAAAYTAVKPATETTTATVLAADKTPIEGAPASPRGVQLIAVTPIADASVHSEELSKGAAFAQERAEREARLQRPLFVLPPRVCSPPASATDGVHCTPVSTWPARSAPRSTPPVTAWWSTPGRRPATAPGSRSGTPTAP